MAKKKQNDDEDLDRYFHDPEFRNKKKKPVSSESERRKRLIIWSSVALVIIVFIIYIISGLPSLEQLENPKPQLASTVYSIDGEVVGQYYIENRVETDIDSLPPYIPKLLISTEDRKFYSHWGVDLDRFVKAMIKNIFTFSHEGASTITQQLARNLYKLKAKHENIIETGIRKIREWITAVQIEKNYTKKEILEMYLNDSYFGRSAYGIESAAKVYFNKRASQLTMPEAALFIALLKSPEYYSPIKHPENALDRRNLVLHNMVTNDMLSEQKYEKLKAEPIKLTSEIIGGERSDAPYFMEYVRQQMTAMSDKYGYDLYRDGLNIYTTVDLRMQRIANKAVEEHLKAYQALFDKNWNWKIHKSLLIQLIHEAIWNSPQYNSVQTKEEKAKVFNELKNDDKFIDSVKKVATKIQVGFVVIDPSNGQIRAMVGGSDLNFGRGLNHVTGIRRQPGSAMKPFVYSTAIDNGYFPAYTLLDQKFDYKGWSPENADGEYDGYMTLRDALANSVNVITGRMTISDIAPPAQVVKYARRMGITSPLDAVPSIALGTSGVSPLEITSAYGTLDNKGVHVDPISILKIEDNNGILIDQFVPNYTEAISPQTASIIVNMMEDVINFGTGVGVRSYFQYPCAGKTGTTQEFADAWFVGFTPDLVAGTWVGFDDHRVKFTNWYGQGARAALPIWAKFMEGTYKELKLPVTYFQLAPGVDSVAFCKETMGLGDSRVATQFCPDSVMDIVNVKNMPPKCEIHNGGKIIKEDKRGDSGW
jgi:penicillin-binding protein 1A